MTFDTDLALQAAGPGAFDLDVPAHWRIGAGSTNGGYVAAVMTRALDVAAADPARRPRSVTLHFLAGCRPGPARITVHVERSGRSLTTMTARLCQGEVTVAVGLASLGIDRPGMEFQHEPMPKAPPPAEVADWPFNRGLPYFTGNWEYRPCVGAMPPASAPRALTGGWIRPYPPRPVDAPLLAAMADAWLPPVALMLQEPERTLPTVDLTIHFRAALPLAEIAPDDFCFAVFESRVGSHGFWESSGVIWSCAGRALAQTRQLALFSR